MLLLTHHFSHSSRALADGISDRLATFTGPPALELIYDGVKVSVKGRSGQVSPQFQGVSGRAWCQQADCC